MINSGNDLLQVDLKIHGDPYFIADVGVGNFLGLPSSPLLPVTLDGSMNPMDGEVYVILNFRTPIDYDEEDGITLFVNPKLPKKTLIATLFHEFVHAKQYINA